MSLTDICFFLGRSGRIRGEGEAERYLPEDRWLLLKMAAFYQYPAECISLATWLEACQSMFCGRRRRWRILGPEFLISEILFLGEVLSNQLFNLRQSW